MNAQIIENILNQAKVDKNGRIMNKGRLNDMIHSEHLKAVKNCSIPAVVGSATCDCGSGEKNFHKEIGCKECC